MKQKEGSVCNIGIYYLTAASALGYLVIICSAKAVVSAFDRELAMPALRSSDADAATALSASATSAAKATSTAAASLLVIFR